MTTVFAISGVLQITLIVTSFILFSSSFGDFDSDGPTGSFVPFLVAVLIGFAVWPSVACWGAKVSNQGLERLKRVCDENSSRHQGISFHVREEQYISSSGNRGVRTMMTNFIEVCVSSDGVTGSTFPSTQQTVSSSSPIVKATAIGAAVPAYNPAVVAGQTPDFDEETGSGKKSAAERMRALDEMKNLLTEEEYQRKRAEILSDI